MTESRIIDAWRAHLQTPGVGLHLVDPRHVLQIFIGNTEQGAPRLVIRSAAKGVVPSLSSLVLVELYEDQGGKWNLSFTLQDTKYTEVFLRLADDLHARTADAVNEISALDGVSLVIEEWWRLLKPRPSGLLSMEELRGLVGELWLLVGEFCISRPIDAALEGWLGPLGLPQDFWYLESGYHEVKTIGPSTTRVRISSEAQLDASSLELVVLRVANTGAGTVGAVNLPTLASRVTAALTELGVGAAGLTERLQRLGVNLSERQYHDTWFVVTQVQSYSVTSEFPAIRASQLDPGITRVSYQLELSAISGFLQRTVNVE